MSWFKKKKGKWPGKKRVAMELSYAQAVSLLLTLAILVILLWSTDKEHASHVRIPNIANFEQALPSIANLANSPVLPGNAVQILENGDFFPAFLADVARARGSIHLEDLRLVEGRDLQPGRPRRAEKARQGVEVRVTLDALGSHRANRKLIATMKKAA